MKQVLLCSSILLLLLMSCKKDKAKDTTPSVPLKGKIAFSPAPRLDGGYHIIDIRKKETPQLVIFDAYVIDGNVKLKFVKTRPLGPTVVRSYYPNTNFGDEAFNADRYWPMDWTNISTIGDFLMVNNDKPSQLYSFYTSPANPIVDFNTYYKNFPAVWNKPGKISGMVSFAEAYGTTSNTRNAFYFDLKTQEYLFQFDSNGPDKFLGGYKITDLIKTSNGNMEKDPIDWTKADLVFAVDVVRENSTQAQLKYNNKLAVQFFFIDLDTKTYASFVRYAKDDPIKGADAGRQALVTTTWQPLSNLFVGWSL